jgi:hypothetical protein
MAVELNNLEQAVNIAQMLNSGLRELRDMYPASELDITDPLAALVETYAVTADALTQYVRDKFNTGEIDGDRLHTLAVADLDTAYIENDEDDEASYS